MWKLGLCSSSWEKTRELYSAMDSLCEHNFTVPWEMTREPYSVMDTLCELSPTVVPITRVKKKSKIVTCNLENTVHWIMNNSSDPFSPKRNKRCQNSKKKCLPQVHSEVAQSPHNTESSVKVPFIASEVVTCPTPEPSRNSDSFPLSSINLSGWGTDLTQYTSKT